MITVKEEELLEEISSLKAEIEEWKEGAEVEAGEADKGRAEIALLKAEVEKLRGCGNCVSCTQWSRKSEDDGWCSELHEMSDEGDSCKSYTDPLTASEQRVKELEETKEGFSKCFRRIAKAVGVETPLQLTAMAENDDESFAELLAKFVEKAALSDTERGE